MNDFFIGDTNFGVEDKQSRVEFAKAADGRLLLTVEIQGSEKVYQDIKADENSEWSWTLYPPQFYLRGYPVPEKIKGKEHKIKLKPEDAANFDVALYLMEHNNVSGVTLLVGDDRIEVSGRVDLMGEPRKFRIKWVKE
jgi:protein tyrosine/serine phosphatase